MKKRALKAAEIQAHSEVIPDEKIKLFDLLLLNVTKHLYLDIIINQTSLSDIFSNNQL